MRIDLESGVQTYNPSMAARDRCPAGVNDNQSDNQVTNSGEFGVEFFGADIYNQ